MEEKVIRLDLRQTPVYQRQPLVFEAWEELETGHVLQLTNDHDPAPLRRIFEEEFEGLYTWETLKEGPDEWVVNIGRIKSGEPPVDEGTRTRVLEALEEIRPYLQADGGDVELVDIDPERRVVLVKLQGACGGCPSAEMTLKAGVEKSIREHAPEIRAVESV